MDGHAITIRVATPHGPVVSVLAVEGMKRGSSLASTRSGGGPRQETIDGGMASGPERPVGGTRLWCSPGWKYWGSWFGPSHDPGPIGWSTI